ncbi:MAG: hypothetical protein Roseis2KO_09120 [Roseivirga sp.]
MLDFYIIPDSHGKPESDDLSRLEYAGGLEFDVYERFTRKGLIDPRFDFYSDFRWNSTLVHEILRSVENNQPDSDFSQLISILNAAKCKECGLIAYGD